MVTGRRKLLLADDSPTTQKVISLTFSDEGMEVVAVSDGDAALRRLEEGAPPDIVLADVVMPGPSGYALCERIKRDARLRHIPVMLLVGTFEPFNEAEARRVGADEVLTKPFQSIRELVSKVGSLLGGSEAKGEGKEQTPQAEGHAESATAAERAAARLENRRAADAAADGAPGGPRDERAEPFAAPDPSVSFADLGADDELIEATPAESYGEAPADAARASAAAASSSSVSNSRPEEVGAGARREREQPAAQPRLEPSPVAAPQKGGAEFEEFLAARSAFSARLSGAAAADDALLDLGGVESSVTSAADEADDFILDLEDDLPSPAAGGRGGAFASESYGYGGRGEAQPDAAGAFAAASHGDTLTYAPQDFSPVFTAEGPGPRAASAEEGQQYVDAPENVYGARGGSGGGRKFVEPSVVPARAEGAFTDGSVEGDVARPPAAAEPSTAGYQMGEARGGLDQKVGAADLSPEAVDRIARRVVEMLSETAVREIAWEVVPPLAELLIRQRLDEERSK